MKGMPLPCEFQGKGVLDIGAGISPDLFSLKWNNSSGKEGFFVGTTEPTSVLDTTRSPSPSPPTSSSTSHGGGGGTRGGGDGGGASAGMTSVAAAVPGTQSEKWPPQPQDTSSGASNAVAESGVGRKEEWGSAELQPIPTTLDMGGVAGNAAAVAAEKCGMGMEDWVSILSESATSPGQEQSIFRWIMGDVEADSSMGFNKLLQSGCGSSDFEFNGGFGVVDQGLGPEPAVTGVNASTGGNLMGITSSLPFPGFTTGANSSISLASNPPSLMANSKILNPPNSMFSPLLSNLLPNLYQQQQTVESVEEKPHVFNPQLLINQHQIQIPPNPSFFLPLSQEHQQQQQQLLLSPPQPKRHNSGGPNHSMVPMQQQQQQPPPFLDSGQSPELFVQRPQQQQGFHHQLQLLPHHSLQQQRPSMAVNSKPAKIGGEELAAQNQRLQQGVIDQLYKAAEMLETGNLVLAQGILARLNHQLSPVGKPFLRAAFYFKEALQLLLHMNNNNNSSFPPHPSPFSLIYKIGAHKSFSEISPILQFANFTCIQALLEALEGFDRIHIVDFDIGYGGQWASLMQELALRNGGTPSLKITAFVSAAVHDELELGLTRENLNHFASEINMAFELEILSLDSLNSTSWSLPLFISENEAVAVNLPVGSSSNYSLPLPLVLRFVKQLSPKIVVSLDRGHDRSDLSFPQHIIYALQSHWALLESLDAVNVNLDALQKIERFLLHPDIEKIVLGRHRSREKTPPWRTLFLSFGFSPLTFSNFNESQAECVVKRSPVRGFHVEKRHSSLVLCWQRKELISASAWRC